MSNLRKRNVASGKGDHSPDSSTATDPLIVDYPYKPADEIAKKTLSMSDGLERFLKGYTKFMGPAVSKDRGIKLLQYTLWMLSHFYKDRVVFRDSLRKLYNELSFARYVVRLMEFPTALEAAKTGSWGASSETAKGIHKILGQIMAWSMVGYYPLEHGAYLQWQAPKLLFPKTGGPSRLAEKLSAWSCRCWLVYTLVEIAQCWLKLREETMLFSTKVKKAIEGQDKNEDDDESYQKLLPEPNTAVMTNLKLQICRDLLFTLPAIHWSLPNWDTKPWLPDPLVNTLMWLEAVVCMYQSVTNFQQQ